jgi:hypothetical protein
MAILARSAGECQCLSRACIGRVLGSLRHGETYEGAGAGRSPGPHAPTVGQRRPEGRKSARGEADRRAAPRYRPQGSTGALEQGDVRGEFTRSSAPPCADRPIQDPRCATLPVVPRSAPRGACPPLGARRATRSRPRLSTHVASVSAIAWSSATDRSLPMTEAVCRNRFRARRCAPPGSAPWLGFAAPPEPSPAGRRRVGLNEVVEFLRNGDSQRFDVFVQQHGPSEKEFQTVQPVTAVLLPVKVRSRRPPRVPCSDTRLAGRATFPRESSGRKSSAAGERCLSRSDRSRRASNRAGRSKANTSRSVETLRPTEAEVGIVEEPTH